MSPTLTPSSISAKQFLEILPRYESHVPARLRELDTFRITDLPKRLLQRQKDGAWLEKDEVVKLVEWKLKHGTFRPNLLKLVQSNPSPSIASTTKSAFAQLNPSNPQPALTTLCTLKGVGPATASLLLSQADPKLPFFSDELFRWLHWEDEAPKSKGRGWDRKIGYTAKEYASLVERCGEVMARLEPQVAGVEVSALEVECVAFVLGREGVDVGGEVDEDRGPELDVKDTNGTVQDEDSVKDGKRRRTQKSDDMAEPRPSKKIKGKGEKAGAIKTDKKQGDEHTTTRSGRKTRSGKTS